MDSLDKKILNKIQRDFPICRRPYAALAEELKTKEEEVYLRIERMMKNKIIRRLGGTFNYRKLNLTGTLVAAQIMPRYLKQVAAQVNQLAGVTHNYKRNAEFNLWFTLSAPSKKEIEKILDGLKKEKGVINLLDLPSKRSFKLKVDFKLNEN